MYRLKFTDAARDDLVQIGDYIARESASRATADSFIERVLGQCEKLASSLGKLGVARPDLRSDMRSVPFGNYTIFFRYRGDALEVVNILESHRDAEAHFAKP